MAYEIGDDGVRIAGGDAGRVDGDARVQDEDTVPGGAHGFGVTQASVTILAARGSTVGGAVGSSGFGVARWFLARVPGIVEVGPVSSVEQGDSNRYRARSTWPAHLPQL